MSDNRGNTRNESAEERALRTGLKVNRLSPEAMARIRAAAEAEWRANIQRSPRRWVRRRRSSWIRDAACTPIAAYIASALATIASPLS